MSDMKSLHCEVFLSFILFLSYQRKNPLELGLKLHGSHHVKAIIIYAMALHAYKRNALVVQHYTSGHGHPSPAHVVGGFKYRILRSVIVILGQLGVVSGTFFHGFLFNHLFLLGCII